jgi:hypothetical protein
MAIRPHGSRHLHKSPSSEGEGRIASELSCSMTGKRPQALEDPHLAHTGGGANKTPPPL